MMERKQRRDVHATEQPGRRDTTRGAGRALGLFSRVAFEIIPSALMVVIVVVMSADVFGRYVLSRPVMWASEVALLAFVWLVYLAAVGVSTRGAHIAVDVLTERLPARVQAVLECCVQLLVVATMAYLVWFGFTYFAEGRFTSLPGLGISKRYIELAIPISALGIGTVAVADLWSALRGVATGEFQPRQPPDDEILDDVRIEKADAEKAVGLP